MTTQTMQDGNLSLLDMKLLKKSTPEVLNEFIDGNFLLKMTKKHFNQVPVDLATKQINKTCKMHNGIIHKNPE